MLKYFEISFDSKELNLKCYRWGLSFYKELKQLKFIDYKRINVMVKNDEKFSGQVTGLDDQVLNIEIGYKYAEFFNLDSDGLKYCLIKLISKSLDQIFKLRNWDNDRLKEVVRLIGDPIYSTSIIVYKSKKNNQGQWIEIFGEFLEDYIHVYAEINEGKKEIEKISMFKLKINPFVFKELFGSGEWKSIEEYNLYHSRQLISITIDIKQKDSKINFNPNLPEEDILEYLSNIVLR